MSSISTTSTPTFGGATYNGIPQMGVQSYLPTGEKRDSFSPEEQKDINRGLSQWWPALFASYGTPVWALLANPAKSAFVSSLFGAGIVGTIAAVKGRFGVGAGLLTAGVGLVAGTLSYYTRRQQNDNVLDLMKRLPPGATKRDMESDPVYQADLNRKTSEMNAMVRSWS